MPFPSLVRSLSLAGLLPSNTAPWSGGPRAEIQWAAKLGFRAVHLDVASPALRPRDLDRSSRRDIAALFRRLQLGFSGVDLWIPPAHFADSAHIQRAVDAVSQAAAFAADIARLNTQPMPVVCIAISPATPAPIVGELAASADRLGVSLADHQWPLPKDGPSLRRGIDPAAILMGGGDPAAEVSRLPITPACARLSDVNAGGRVSAGSGRLDLLAYEVALSTRGYNSPLIVDLRGVQDQGAAAAALAPDLK